MKYSFFYIAAFLGCNEMENKKIDSQKTKLNNPDQSFELCFDNKLGIKNGNSILYSKDSIKILETFFLNDLKSGVEKAYYKDGKLEYIGNYKNDKKDSIWTWFYPNGKVESISYWVNDVPWGDKIGYFEDGKIDYIAYQDVNGDVIFMREYNKELKLIKSEREPVQILVNKYKFIKNEIFELKIMISAFERFENHFNITVVNKITNEIAVWKKNISIEDLIVGGHSKLEILNRKMESSGEYEILINAIIIDKIIKDTIFYDHGFNIIVK